MASSDFFPQSEFEQRIANATKRIQKEKLDALLIYTQVNRLYLTGFPSTNMLVVIEAGQSPRVFTDFRYIEGARSNIKFADVQMTTADLLKALAPLAKKGKWRRVGYEGSISSTRYDAQREALPDVTEWVDSENILRDLRSIKSKLEEEAIRKAVLLTDEIIQDTFAQVKPGMTERQIHRIFLHRMLDSEAQAESFDSIVSVGAHASCPHATPGERVLRLNQPLLFDTGVLYNYYHADLTRTVFYGKPSERMKEIYAIVLEAQTKAIKAIRAGKTGEEIHMVAEKVIADAGYGKRFQHGLGHGVGLEIHEAPRFAKGHTTKLQPGMVMTVEPGIYLPGVGGVRIEDVIIVREKGCEILTTSPKKLTCY
jgi:Xaa-Pro aminopeptidase